MSDELEKRDDLEARVAKLERDQQALSIRLVLVLLVFAVLALLLLRHEWKLYNLSSPSAKDYGYEGPRD